MQFVKTLYETELSRVEVVQCTKTCVQYVRKTGFISNHQEHRLLSLLRGHPNFICLYDGRVEQRGDATVSISLLEYCQAGDVLDLIISGKMRLTALQAVHHVRTMCAALQHMYDITKHFHGDISLENILYADGVFKLCDLGLAAPIDSLQFLPQGKQVYMAPELLIQDLIHEQYIPTASDVFSLGVCFFQLIWGVMPFGSKFCVPSHNALYNHFCQYGMAHMIQRFGLQDQSIEVIGLLDGMLALDPRDRLTVSGIIQSCDVMLDSHLANVTTLV